MNKLFNSCYVLIAKHLKTKYYFTVYKNSCDKRLFTAMRLIFKKIKQGSPTLYMCQPLKNYIEIQTCLETYS